jgi:hypothetical protein
MGEGAATAVMCVLGVISFILALFCGQYFANFMHATGVMWWVFAIIGYVVSGAIFGGITWGIVAAVS